MTVLRLGDLVRELLSQESQLSEGRLLKKYLKPDLLIIDDMGLKIAGGFIHIILVIAVIVV